MMLMGAEPAPLFTQRATLVLLIALLVGVAGGVLAYLAGRNRAEATLIGGGAAGATLVIFNPLIS